MRDDSYHKSLDFSVLCYNKKKNSKGMGKVMIKKVVTAVILMSVLLTRTAHALPVETATMAPKTATIEDTVAVALQIAEMETEVEVLANVVKHEAGGIGSRMEQAAVIWCVLNRVDNENYSDDIIEVATSRHQFAYVKGYNAPQWAKDLAADVLARWLLEKLYVTDVGRVLPKEYVFFAGRSGHNWFRSSYSSRDYWEWTLPSPYEEDAE